LVERSKGCTAASSAAKKRSGYREYTATTKEAIEQIQTKEYYNKYLLDKRELVLIGVNFDSSNGSIKEWEKEIISNL